MSKFKIKDETGTFIEIAKASETEKLANKVTSMTSSSTNNEYPSAKCVYDEVTNLRSVAEGKCKSFVINTKSEITGTEDANNNFTNVSAITGVTLTDLKVGDIILIKQVDVPDYWVSQISPSYSLNKMETSKIDLTNYVTKANPTTSGLLVHEANGAGSTAQAVKLRSNNAYLIMYGDASSNAHLGGVGVAFDTTVFINGGMTFQTYGQSLNFNAASVTNVGVLEVYAGATNRVVTGCDFNGYPAVMNQNFVVKNKNITGGLNDNWSYQAYQYNTSTSAFDRNFGVKSNGNVVATGTTIDGVDTTNGVCYFDATSTKQSNALKFVKLTNAEYTALATKDADTMYIIVG